VECSLDFFLWENLRTKYFLSCSVEQEQAVYCVTGAGGLGEMCNKKINFVEIMRKYCNIVCKPSPMQNFLAIFVIS